MRPLRNPSEILVLGGGLAGLSAARHAARLGRAVTLLEGAGVFGGQVATTARVDGLPTPAPVSGQDVALHLLDECRRLGVAIIEEPLVSLDPGPPLVAHHSGGRLVAEAMIVATGARLRALGVPDEARFAGRGLSHCATCDGPFFRGRAVAVIGGGDSALQEALTLARTSRTVLMICRGPLRAKRQYIEAMAKLENVRWIWHRTVAAILGDEAVTGLRLRGPACESEQVECAGVFPYLGTQPNAGFLPAALRDAGGHVVVDAAMRTRQPRLYAAGAVRAGYGGDVAQAMADGVTAAAAAVQDLSNQTAAKEPDHVAQR